MFSKTNKEVDKEEFNIKRPTTPSLISADVTIVGNIVSARELQIDGRIEGDVRGRLLVVGLNAEIVGSLQADVLKIHGKVSGQLCAQSVYLAHSAKVTGDITHERLEIAPGAFLEGHCRHSNGPIAAGQAPADLMLTDERPRNHKKEQQ